MSGVSITCRNNIHIGDDVLIGGGTVIMDSDMHSLDWHLRCTPGHDVINAKCSPVIIGNNVFIGANCIIGKGVEIGDKSIIAAGSVVIKSIPPFSIAGGNPCKVIGVVSN